MSVASFLKKQVVPRAYTVNDESKYLIVRNIPALKCIGELVKLFEQHGPIEEHRVLDMEEREPFTEVCWIKFVHISNARFAKRKLDDFKFYGNLLQVTYAPEYESVSDTLQKLEARRSTVLKILNPSKQKRLHTDTTNVPTEAFVTYPVIQQHEELEATKHDPSTASHCPDEPKINEMSQKQFTFSQVIPKSVEKMIFPRYNAVQLQRGQGMITEGEFELLEINA
eukprot:TRINITY_DN25735_c0_g1_i2.p1 TRINITY_DN25735_c0_g1~~TRINITY_DN25735_c0_g1_i2.p1  ORF type:complete len:225 (-),score=41.60 TRINITY_DN25735_c0_g1_i2:127-801(-)